MKEGVGYLRNKQWVFGMTILRYKEDMVLFRESISKSCSLDFKSVMLKILKRTMAREEKKEGYIAKGEILGNSIK